MFAKLHKYWTEEQIVEIVGVISLFGFLNRWNDTFATPLENQPIELGQKYLTRRMGDRKTPLTLLTSHKHPMQKQRK